MKEVIRSGITELPSNNVGIELRGVDRLSVDSATGDFCAVAVSPIGRCGLSVTEVEDRMTQ